MTIRLDWLLGAMLALASTRCAPTDPEAEAGTGGTSPNTGAKPSIGGSAASAGGGAPGAGGNVSAGGASNPPSAGTSTGAVATSTGGQASAGSAAAGMATGGSSARGGATQGGADTGGNGATGGASANGGTGGGSSNRAGGGAGSAGANGGNAGAAAGAKSTGGSGAAGGSGSGGQGTGGSGTLSNLTVYIASDSTASTYTNSAIHQGGWGQFLQTYLEPKAKVDNRAIGGRTARRFIDEGYLDKILQVIKAGDYLLIQFGTNDGNQTATYTFNGQTIPYYLAAGTDFKTWMTKYVTLAREHLANPVFVTPPPRRSCTGDSHSFGNGLAAYATAMKEMGSAQDVPVVDLNLKTLTHLNTIGCVAAGTDFFLVNADGSVDGTHFQEKGATLLAGFVAAGLRELNFGLSPYVK